MTPRSSRSSSVKAYLALGAGILCIGFSAIFVKFAAVPGPVSAFYRTFVASAALLPWWLGRGPRLPGRKDMRLILLGGVFFAVDLVLWNSSLLLTPAATATLLANNAPLWVGLGSLWLFREKLPGLYWVGLALSLAGMTILIGETAWYSHRLNAGDLMALAASGCYAVYLLSTQHARAHVDTLTFMTLSTLTSLALLGAGVALFGLSFSGYSAKAWMSLLGLGLISHLAGWLAINYALGHLRAAPLSVSLLGQALVTALLAIPLFGETLRTHQLIGGTLVLAGIFLVNHRRTRAEAGPTAPENV